MWMNFPSRLRHVSRKLNFRHVSSKPQPPNTPISSPAASSQQRIDRILKRTPAFLHKHVVALRSSPVSHVTAFLLLHELTAVIPLFGLASAFHYYNWLPPFFAEGAWVVTGVEKFGRYFKRKGWITDEDENEIEREAEAGADLRGVEAGQRLKSQKAGGMWNKGEGSIRLVVEFATAYAIVKAFLIPRLIISAWLAPNFARWTVIPVVNVVSKSRVVQVFRQKVGRKRIEKPL